MEYFFSSKEKKNTDAFYMDEPQKLYAKSKKPFTKDHILYDHAYVKY